MKILIFYDYFYYILWQKEEKKFKQVIQLPELNQPEFDWFGLVRIQSKKFMNPNQLKLIGSDLFFPQT